MTKENKELLTKDLYARLPHKVKVNYADEIYDVFGCSGNNLIIVLPFLSNLEAHPIETCKPYLRPMSSMTEEEIKEWDNICVMMRNMPVESIPMIERFVNGKHLDYNNLISKGLALEAPEGMYDFK